MTSRRGAQSMPRIPRAPIPEDLRLEIVQRARQGQSYVSLTKWVNVELARRKVVDGDGRPYQVARGTIVYLCRQAGLPRRESVGGFREVEDPKSPAPTRPPSRLGPDAASVRDTGGRRSAVQPRPSPEPTAPRDPDDAGEWGA